jgi:hypothetical protein
MIVPQGSIGTPKKTTFPREFFNETYTIHLYTKDNHIPAKNENYFYRLKIAAKIPIFISYLGKNSKNTFRKEFFNENRLK